MAPPLKSITEECCDEVKGIIDRSQGVQSDFQRQAGGIAFGHPRHHVLCNKFDLTIVKRNNPGECADAVTQFYKTWKTAFENFEV